MADEGIPQQISSHSSFLTNARINILLQSVDYWSAESWAKPSVPNIERYFANVYTVFNNIFVIMNDDELKKIKKYFGEYWDGYVLLKTDPTYQSIQNVHKLLNICDSINRGMRAILQGYRYFFVMAAKEARRIEDGLKILESGGGIFGGFAEVPRVSRDTDKPE